MQVAAKEVHVDQGYQGVKWDSNWDKRYALGLSDAIRSTSEEGWNLGFLIIVSVRDPASLVKPLKESATDEEKAAREVKLAESKPKVSLLFSTALLHKSTIDFF